MGQLVCRLRRRGVRGKGENDEMMEVFLLVLGGLWKGYIGWRLREGVWDYIVGARLRTQMEIPRTARCSSLIT